MEDWAVKRQIPLSPESDEYRVEIRVLKNLKELLQKGDICHPTFQKLAKIFL